MHVKFVNRLQMGNITRAVDKSTPMTLSRAAGAVRLTARRLIRTRRNRDKASMPGQPPFSHGFFRNTILYALAEDRRSAVIGPILTRGNPTSNVARLHEFGNTEQLRGRRRKYEIGDAGPLFAAGSAGQTSEKRRNTRQSYLTPGAPKNKAPKTGVAFAPIRTIKQLRRARALDRLIWPDADAVRLVRYPPRPYMRVALRKMLPRLTGFWTNAISN